MENVSTRNSSRLEISRNLRYKKNCISVNSELKLFRRRQCLRKLYLFSVPTKGKFSKIEWLINRFRPFYKKEDWNFCSILLYVHLFSNKLCYDTYKQCLYYEYTVHHASLEAVANWPDRSEFIKSSVNTLGYPEQTVLTTTNQPVTDPL